MAQEQKEKATSLEEFSFDDNADWSFGTPAKDKTSTSTVVNKVKAGTTIDEDEEEDDDAATNLEEDNTADDDEDDEDNTTQVKAVKKVAAKPTPAKPEKKVENKKKEKEEDKEDDEDEEEEVTFDTFTDAPKDKSKTNKVGSKDTEEEPEEEPEEDEYFYTNLASELKEKGVLENVEIPKDKKLTEEEFFELQDTEIEVRVKETIEAFTEKMDEDGKAFMKHKVRGGSTKDFIETYYGSGIDYDKFDPEDAAQVDELNRFYVSTVEGLKGDDLEDRLQGLKDSGKAKAKATDWASKLQKIENKAKEDLAAKVEEDYNKKKENTKKFNESLIDALDKVSTVGGFTISKEDKKKLAPFMTKATVKVGKDQYVPPLQIKLAAILNPKNKESREKLIVLAKLVENDFDISDLVPKIETTVIKRANKLLQRSKVNTAPSSSGGYGRRVLADAFAEDDD